MLEWLRLSEEARVKTNDFISRFGFVAPSSSSRGIYICTRARQAALWQSR
jgi:hypothetical protein